MDIISRKDAQSLGLKRYFTGKPCPVGHISERYVSSQTCRKCGKDQTDKKRKGTKAHYHKFCDIWKAAKLSKDRLEFSQKFPGLCSAARKRKIMNYVCGHMPASKTAAKWTFCKVFNIAKNYKSQTEFCKSNSGAADFALKSGIMPAVTAHMQRLNSDYNVVYAWGYWDDNVLVCKFGVTSQRLGEERIKSVSKKSGIPIEFQIMIKTRSSIEAEKHLVAMGNDAGFKGFNGSSEFRVFHKDDLKKIYEVMYEYAE